MKEPRSVAAALMCLVLGALGCGADDQAAPTTTVESTGGASYEITAQEFITALAGEKREILEEYVASEPNDCSEIDDGFVLTATAAATEVPPDAPLEDVILEICGEPDAR